MIELMSIIHEFRDVTIGVYAEGFHNKALFLDTVLEEAYDEDSFIDELGEKISKPAIENVEYKWYRRYIDESSGEEYLDYSEVEQIGFTGITVIEWK